MRGPSMRVTDRLRTWRRDAAIFRGYGDAGTADLLERLAEELEADLDEGAGELVGLARAVLIAILATISAASSPRASCATSALPQSPLSSPPTSPASPAIRVHASNLRPLPRPPHLRGCRLRAPSSQETERWQEGTNAGASTLVSAAGTGS